MKKIEVIANNCLHYLTEDQILAKIKELGIDPNDEVNEGDKVRFGHMTFLAHDWGGAGRKLLTTAEDQPTQVVCPTCNGEGVVNA